MTTALATIDPELLESVVVTGDLSRLAPAQRLEWYRHRCDAAGLDPRTQPLQYLVLQGKLVLYAAKATTDQLIANRKLTVEIIDRRTTEGDIYEVTVRVTRPDRSTVEDVGCVSLSGLRGDALCNARMKAITKAKRRTVLSACGLGMLDESELETVRGAQRVPMESAHAEVQELPALPAAAPEPQDELAAIAPWLARIHQAEERGSAEELDQVRDQMTQQLKKRSKAQGESLRRAIETARAAIAARRAPESPLDTLTAALQEASSLEAVKKQGTQWDQWAEKQGAEQAEVVKEGYARITARMRELQP